MYFTPPKYRTNQGFCLYDPKYHFQLHSVRHKVSFILKIGEVLEHCENLKPLLISNITSLWQYKIKFA